MKRSNFIFILAFCALLSHVSQISLFAQGSFPLSLNVSLAPPYPTHLSDFTDIETQLFVDVFNSSAETYFIVLTGSLENESRGISIRTDPGNPPATEITVGPGSNRLELSDMEELFDPNHLIFHGASASDIRRDEALPEGEYALCIRAFDATNPGRALSPDPTLFVSGCTRFNVSFIDEPEIVIPIDRQPISTTYPVIPIQWIWNRTIMAADNVSFTLRIVEMDPSGRDPNDVLLSSTTPELFFEEGIMETFYNLNVPDDALLESGRSYVIQVIAADETGELTFKNGGRSEPVVFHFQEPMFTFSRPQWITEQGITFRSALEVEVEYEIPLPEDTEVEIEKNIYVFEIPEGMSAEEAYGLGDFIAHDNIINTWSNDYNPSVYVGFESSFIYGNTYGAIIVISDPHRREEYFFESGGESEILVFSYGDQIRIPKPEWITRQDSTFENPDNIELAFRVQMPEDQVVSLDGHIKYFEIPAGSSPELAAQNEEGLHYLFFASGISFDDRPIEQSALPGGDDLEPGKQFGAYIEISDATRMDDHMYHFENNGRSEILTFSMAASSSLTDVVLTYPVEGDRIPFSFFPLVARYQPFNVQYQHWKSELTLLKDGSPHDSFTGDGLRWPGGSQAAQRTLTGLSDITEDESQNVAVYKNNSQRSAPFERGSNFRWETNVKLYNDVPATGPFIEFEKTSTFSRGMGPSGLLQPEWGAIIAPDSAFNFRWNSAEAPEKLFPVSINHATRTRIDYFNGRVDEKWVLEVSRSEDLDTVIFHADGMIGNGMDYLSGLHSEEQVISELYKELATASTFTPTDTGYYYWRVKWLSDPDADWSSSSYESSQIRPFWVGDGPPPGLSSRADPPEGCVSECLVPEISNVTPLTTLTPGSTVSVGYFEMNVTEITGSSGGNFSGSGEIRVPFLANVRLSVEFDDIQINTDRQMIGGEVNAVNDMPSISMDENEVMIGGQSISIPSMTETESEALEAAITGTERLVSMLSDERAMGMPLGLDNEIDGVAYVIGITAMTFESRNATLAAVMRLDIPSLGNHIPALGANEICFTPNGLGDEGRLYLHRDWSITPDDSDVLFSFSGCEDGDTTQSTYVEWDCQGFKCMSIRGEVEFDTDMLVKEDADGHIVEGENVVADFGVKTCRGGNWIADIGIEPFQIKGMNGWGFHSARAYLDFSDIENPPLLNFPDNYDTRYLGAASSEGGESSSESSSDPSARLLNTWKGFYLTELVAHVPPDFEDDVLGRPSFGIQNMIIDFGNGGGITVSIVGEDIIDYESGSVDNLSFSLDSVRINVVQSSIIEGGLKGKLGLPIFADDDYLNYEGLVVYSSDTFAINFNVNVTDTLDVPMWNANMFFEPESTIGITHKSGSEGTKTYVYTDLTGGIDIVGDLVGGGGSVPGVNFRGIRFEHIVYNSDGSQFDIGNFSFTSPQKSAAGFPVNINDIGIDLSMPRVGLTFDLALVLSDAGFSAEAGFGVYAALDLTGDRDLFRFDGVDLRSIEISQQCNGITLEGRLDFYNDDATYGDGVRGYVHAILPMDIEGSLTVQFGTKKTPGIENPAFNTRDYFPYWYVDGLIRIPAGITVFSGFAIYGFGGGVYYRMRPDYAALTSTASMFGEEGAEPSSGVRYIPDWEILGGFKIMAILGTQPSEEAFNMDVTIEMNFTSSGGVGLFSIDGEGYVMASFENRPEAKIWATVHFAYVNPGDGSERVEGNFALYVDFGQMLHGIDAGNRFVYAEFLVQDDIWYYYMGKPDSRGGLEVDLQILKARMDSYFMVGHGVPRRLPPLPEFIANLVYGPSQSELNGGSVNPSNVSSREWTVVDEMKMSTAKGFAFGTSFHIETRFDFAIFYAELEAMFGFDILVNEDPARVCFETGESPGINNWYAMGQIYAGLRGEMGIQVDLFFIKGEFPIIELAAAISLRGGFPNPTWAEGRAGLYYRILNGLVEGQCNFKVILGEKCSPVDENPLSSIAFIADILPADGTSATSVFITPSVSFNLPVNKVIEIPAGLDDEPDKVRVFRPFIERFVLDNVQGGSRSVPGTFEFNETSTIATFVLDDPEAFEAYSRFKVQIIVRATEYFPDGSSRLVSANGRTWEDNKTIFFTTGARPAVLVDEVIDFTYPIIDQVYFLKGEAHGSKGLIKWNRSQRYLFERNIEDKEYVYMARFKPVSGGDALESEITAEASGISYTLPDIDNSAYYAIQIVRKPYSSMAESTVQYIGPVASASTSTVLQPIIKNFNLEGSTVRVNLGQKLPGESVRSGEILLYHYYFRTSKFDNLNDKLASLSFDVERVSSIFEFFRLTGDVPEQFEEFDVYGYHKGGVQKLKPLIQFSAPYRYKYHTDVVNPGVYGLKVVLDQLRSRDAVLARMPVANLNSHRKGFPPTNSVDFSSSNSVGFPLQDWEIEREAGVQRQQAGSTTSTSAQPGSATSTTTQPESVTSAMTHPGISSLLGGTSSNIKAFGGFSADLMGGSSSSYDLEILYSMSNYVKFDASAMKRTLSRIISYRNEAGAYVYQNQLIREHPAAFSLIFNALTKNADSYNYTGGRYGVSIEYLAPTLNGTGDREMTNQRRKSSVLRTFNY